MFVIFGELWVIFIVQRFSFTVIMDRYMACSHPQIELLICIPGTVLVLICQQREPRVVQWDVHYSYGQLGHVHDCIAYARVHTVTECTVQQHSHVVALMKRVSPRIWSVGALRLWRNRQAYGIFPGHWKAQGPKDTRRTSWAAKRVWCSDPCPYFPKELAQWVQVGRLMNCR